MLIQMKYEFLGDLFLQQMSDFAPSDNTSTTDDAPTCQYTQAYNREIPESIPTQNSSNCLHFLNSSFLNTTAYELNVHLHTVAQEFKLTDYLHL